MLLTDFGETWKHARVEVAKKSEFPIPMLNPDTYTYIIDDNM